MKFCFSKEFQKDFDKMPHRIQILFDRKLTIFKQNQFHQSLRTHKLSGTFDGYWTFSINYKYRVLFEFSDIGTIFFHAIGTHEIYK